MYIPNVPSAHQPFGEITLGEVDLSLVHIGARDQNQVISRYKNIHGGTVYAPIKIPRRLALPRRPTTSLMRHTEGGASLLQDWLAPGTWLRQVFPFVQRLIRCGRVNPVERASKLRRKRICKLVEQRTGVTLGASSVKAATAALSMRHGRRLSPEGMAADSDQYLDQGLDHDTEDFDDDDDDDDNRDGLAGVSIGAGLLTGATTSGPGSSATAAGSTEVVMVEDGKARIDHAERIFAIPAESLTVEGEHASPFAWHPFRARFAIALQDDSVAIGELVTPQSVSPVGPFQTSKARDGAAAVSSASSGSDALSLSSTEQIDSASNTDASQRYPWLRQLLCHPLMIGVRDISFCPVTGTMLAVACAHGIMLWVFNRKYPSSATVAAAQFKDVDGFTLSPDGSAMYFNSEPNESLADLVDLASQGAASNNMHRPAEQGVFAHPAAPDSKSSTPLSDQYHASAAAGSSSDQPLGFDTAHVVLLTTPRTKSFGPVQRCAFSPCGRFIAASHRDSSAVIIWDVSLARAAALVNPPIVGSDAHKVLLSSAASAATAAARHGVAVFSPQVDDGALNGAQPSSNAIMNAVRPGTALGDVRQACVQVFDSMETALLSNDLTVSSLASAAVSAVASLAKLGKSTVPSSNHAPADGSTNEETSTLRSGPSALRTTVATTRDRVIRTLGSSVKDLLWCPAGGVLLVTYKHRAVFTLIDTHCWRAESFDTADGMPVAAAAWSPRRGATLLFATENSSKVYSLTLAAPAQAPALPVVAVSSAGATSSAASNISSKMATTSAVHTYSQAQILPQNYGAITNPTITASQSTGPSASSSSGLLRNRLAVVSTSTVFDLESQRESIANPDQTKLEVIAAVSHGLAEIDIRSLCVDSIAWSPTCDRVILSFKTKRTGALLRNELQQPTLGSTISRLLGGASTQEATLSRFDAPSLAELALSPDETPKVSLSKYSAPGSELMLLVEAPVGVSVRLSPIGFVRGPPSAPCRPTESDSQSELNRPLRVAFAPSFDRGALLATFWRSGFVTFLPMYFTPSAGGSSLLPTSGDSITFLP